MAYKLEDGISIPDNGAGRPGLYPFADMEIGQSFLVPKPEALRAQSAASGCARRHDRKFAQRAVEGGVRFWRVA